MLKDVWYMSKATTGPFPCLTISTIEVRQVGGKLTADLVKDVACNKLGTIGASMAITNDVHHALITVMAS